MARPGLVLFAAIALLGALGCGRQGSPGKQQAPLPMKKPIVITGVIERLQMMAENTPKFAFTSGAPIDTRNLQNAEQYVGRRAAVHGHQENYRGEKYGPFPILVAERAELRQRGCPNVSDQRAPAANEQIQFGGNTYKLHVELSVDLMPSIGPPRPRLLGAQINLVEQSQRPIPSSVDVTRLWGTCQGELWFSGTTAGNLDATGTPEATDPSRLAIIPGDPPEWDDGQKVDLTVEVTDGQGNWYYLKAVGQEIIGDH